MPRIDATAAVPIDVASKLALGWAETVGRAQAAGRRTWRQLRFRLDQLHSDQLTQLIVMVLYALIALAEAFASTRRKRD